MSSPIHDIVMALDNSLTIKQGSIHVTNPTRFKQVVHILAEMSALESGERQGLARFLTRTAALDLGIFPASIHDLYMARGRGEVPPVFSVPAMNLRVLSFDEARAAFRAAAAIHAGAFIFEIARSEMGYTDQRPAEYTTSILAAAIAEGYKGPVFIQGDHFQVSAKRYATDPEGEIESLRALIREAIKAGFYNIDIDTSTMVDMNQPTVIAQQVLNTQLSAMFTTYIRTVQPQGVTISVGGEIGEVGGHNSTEDELCAYLDGFKNEVDQHVTGITGLSKISIQTGTSHGGVVLPDGSIAQVEVDFETMHKLSQIARKKYGLGGAVQHGASTLPEEAFGKFVEAEACEVHLATNFMNMFYDQIPHEFREEIYKYLGEKFASERKQGMTDEQFYYKTRKNAVGPFKAQSWGLPVAVRDSLGKSWEAQFSKLFHLLGLTGTQKFIQQTIRPVNIQPAVKDYLGENSNFEDVSDLAD
jgi:fructose/tagatose bisphosphate aldolase